MQIAESAAIDLSSASSNAAVSSTSALLSGETRPPTAPKPSLTEIILTVFLETMVGDVNDDSELMSYVDVDESTESNPGVISLATAAAEQSATAPAPAQLPRIVAKLRTIKTETHNDQSGQLPPPPFTQFDCIPVFPLRQFDFYAACAAGPRSQSGFMQHPRIQTTTNTPEQAAARAHYATLSAYFGRSWRDITLEFTDGLFIAVETKLRERYRREGRNTEITFEEVCQIIRRIAPSFHLPLAVNSHIKMFPLAPPAPSSSLHLNFTSAASRSKPWTVLCCLINLLTNLDWNSWACRNQYQKWLDRRLSTAAAAASLGVLHVSRAGMSAWPEQKANDDSSMMIDTDSPPSAKRFKSSTFQDDVHVAGATEFNQSINQCNLY